MKKLFLMLLVATQGLAQTTPTADESKAVRQVIDQLFTAMRQADTTSLRAVFHPNCRMQTMFVSAKTGKPELQTEPNIQNFIRAVGTPRKEILDERVLNCDIKIDGPMATAWVPYELWLGNTFIHCGVDVFVFFKSEQGWKIAALADTRRKKDCNQ
jgi:Putative lumazine-binding